MSIFINRDPQQQVKRQARVFPKNEKILAQLGENIKLARKRRGYSQQQICERSGLSRVTIRNIESGSASVSMGHYVTMLAQLGLVDDLLKVAADDKLGRKLQDIKLLGGKITG